MGYSLPGLRYVVFHYVVGFFSNLTFSYGRVYISLTHTVCIILPYSTFVFTFYTSQLLPLPLWRIITWEVVEQILLWNAILWLENKMRLLFMAASSSLLFGAHENHQINITMLKRYVYSKWPLKELKFASNSHSVYSLCKWKKLKYFRSIKNKTFL